MQSTTDSAIIALHIVELQNYFDWSFDRACKALHLFRHDIDRPLEDLKFEVLFAGDDGYDWDPERGPSVQTDALEIAEEWGHTRAVCMDALYAWNKA